MIMNILKALMGNNEADAGESEHTSPTPGEQQPFMHAPVQEEASSPPENQKRGLFSFLKPPAPKTAGRPAMRLPNGPARPANPLPMRARPQQVQPFNAMRPHPHPGQRVQMMPGMHGHSPIAVQQRTPNVHFDPYGQSAQIRQQRLAPPYSQMPAMRAQPMAARQRMYRQVNRRNPVNNNPPSRFW